MRMIILILILINLVACKSMVGNVVPEKGPTMEQVYDSVDDSSPTTYRSISHVQPVSDAQTPFHKLPNPELKMYVFPHLAGEEEIPIPGYFTAFNAYNRDYYTLPSAPI